MRLLLLLVAAVIAVLAGVAALQLSTPPEAPGAAAVVAQATQQNVNTVDVLVARGPIPVGTVITADMFDKQPWPENLVLQGFITATGPNANIAGKVTRSPFQAREPLIISKLANKEDSGFLAASLPAGMRAVTIATDAVSGVAGFVFPGDRVDLVFTHNIPKKLKAEEGASAPGMQQGGGGGDNAGFAEVLAANVPVLAVNIREASSPADAAVGAMATANGGSAAMTTTPSSMTLQVSDLQAEKIRLAEKVGTLSIALRSVNDRNNTNPSQPADLLSLTQLDTEQAAPTGDTLKVVRGGDMSGAAAAPQYRQQGGQR